MSIATNLRRVRLEKKLTQRQLAEKIGVKYSTYSNWENQHSTPSPMKLVEIAEALDVSTDYLLGLKTEGNPRHSKLGSGISMEKERTQDETILDETDRAAQEVNKLEQLGHRIDQYKDRLQPELDYFVNRHNHYLTLIDQTGFNEPDSDVILLGPATLARIELWYSMARKEAYNVSGKCRDLQKFYLAVAEQGKSNQYERVRLRQYHKDMNSATDAKEISRRVGGRLEEKAAYWEGEYMRWNGIAEAYEQTGFACKDLLRIAEYEMGMGDKNS